MHIYLEWKCRFNLGNDGIMISLTVLFNNIETSHTQIMTPLVQSMQDECLSFKHFAAIATVSSIPGH